MSISSERSSGTRTVARDAMPRRANARSTADRSDPAHGAQPISTSLASAGGTGATGDATWGDLGPAWWSGDGRVTAMARRPPLVLQLGNRRDRDQEIIGIAPDSPARAGGALSSSADPGLDSGDVRMLAEVVVVESGRRHRGRAGLVLVRAAVGAP